MKKNEFKEELEGEIKKSRKTVTIVSFVVLFLFCASVAAATSYYVANYKTENEFKNSINFKDIAENRALVPEKVTPDYSSGEAVIRTYYKALAAKDYETALSCFSEKAKKDNNYTLESFKKGWENYKKIGIKSLTVRYEAASARIYEALVVEDVEYYDDSVIAGNPDTRFISTADVDYNGNWRITQIATSPINLD